MKYPLYIQHDSTDCGPTCLRMIAKFYGKDIPFRYIKERCYQKKSGTTLLDLSSAAESIGLRSCGMKVTYQQLSSMVKLPCIISWNQRHFIVVYKISGKKVIVGDPSHGILKYDTDSFLKGWISLKDEIKGDMGIILTLEPTNSFYSHNSSGTRNYSEKIGFRKLVTYVVPYYKLTIYIILAIIVSSIMSLCFPLLSQAVVDIGIENRDLKFIAMILVAQIILVLGQAVNELSKNWIMLNVSIRVNLSLVSDFLGKLMRLPISFFDTKRTGDLMQRIGDFSRIQTFLTETIISIIMAALAIAIYSIMIAGYNIAILTVFIVGSIFYILWVFIFLKRRKKLDYMRFQEASYNNSNVIQLISGMQEIKLNNCERKKRWEWEQIQTRLYDIELKSLTLSQIQQIGGLLIDQTKNIVISFISAYAVISGDMSIGMMLALQYIIGQLNAPVAQCVSFIESIQDTKISLERLNDIQQIEDEETMNTCRVALSNTRGDIRLENVTFQYGGPRSSLILKKINFAIPYGKTTAIVGVSGSGKTTLLKLLLGFYAPTDGQITIGMHDLNNINSTVWRHMCGAVMQDGFIFSDTIAGNIAVSDKEIDMQKVIYASKMANLDDFIESLPLGYNTLIGADGNGISNGQRQRILIARVIYKNPQYIFFDEATNSLDANNEQAIMQNLSVFLQGKTSIVVAHRLSTVRNADNIIVIDKGQIVEHGTHEELLSHKSHYYNLVKNQLELGI